MHLHTDGKSGSDVRGKWVQNKTGSNDGATGNTEHEHVSNLNDFSDR